jgi:hypothetical protein
MFQILSRLKDIFIFIYQLDTPVQAQDAIKRKNHPEAEL